MIEAFKNLSTLDYIYAALVSFMIFHIIKSIMKIKRSVVILHSAERADMDRENFRLDIIKKCKAMFPVGTINFRGKVFTSGMLVRITTLQKRIIEGEIIGKNEDDVLCIVTREHIIAHEMEKIEDITELVNAESAK